MRRRALLFSGVLSSWLGLLSGCLEEELEATEGEPPVFEDRVDPEEVDLPVGQRLEVAESAIGHASGSTIDNLDHLVSYLDERTVSVADHRMLDKAGKPVIELAFAADSIADRGFMYHLGIVAGGYATLVESMHDGERLEAVLLDSRGQRFGRYEILRRWAEEFNDGTTTARGYALEISKTTKSTA